MGRAAGRPRRRLTDDARRGPVEPRPRRVCASTATAAPVASTVACPRSSPPASPTPTRAATCSSATSPSRWRPATTPALVGANGVGKSTLLRVPRRRPAARRGRGRARRAPRPHARRTSASTATADGPRAAARPRPGRPARGGDARCSGPSATSPPAPTRPRPAWRSARRSATWSELGGYELEGQWDAACRRDRRRGLRRGRRPRRADELSGGERKRLVLELLLHRRRRRAAARRARQLPRRPRQARARAAHRGVAEDDPAHQPRPRAAGRRGAHDPSRSRAPAPGSTAGPTRPTPRRARTARSSWATRCGAGRTRSAGSSATTSSSRSAPGTRPTSRRRPTPRRRAGSASSTPARRPPPVVDQQIRVRLRGARLARAASWTCATVALDGLVRPFSDEVHFGERVGLIGPNGTGKTHLIRLLAGDPVEHEGEVVVGPRVSPGLFTQLNARDDLAGQDVARRRRRAPGRRAGRRWARWPATAWPTRRAGPSRRSPAARRRAWRSSAWSSRATTCCCSTSRRTTSTSTAPRRWSRRSTGSRARSSRSPTTARFLRGLDRFWLLDREGDVTVLPDARAALEAVATDGRVAAPRATGSPPALRR